MGFKSALFYFHDELDKNSTLPLGNSPVASQRVQMFAESNDEIIFDSNGLMFKLHQSKHETVIVCATSVTTAAKNIPLISIGCKNLQNRLNHEMAMVQQLREARDMVRQDNLIFRLVQVLGDKINGDENASIQTIADEIVAAVGCVFPRTRSTSFAVLDSDGQKVVNLASLGIDWDRYQTDGAMPFERAMEIMNRQKMLRGPKKVFVHAALIRNDNTSLRFDRGGDCFIAPITFTERGREAINRTALLTLSTEAGRYLSPHQLRAFEHIVSLAQRTLETNQVVSALAVASKHDGPTGLINKEEGNQSLLRSFEQAKKSGLPLSLVMLDLDKFKVTNDTYGHVSGDMVLRQLAKIMDQLAADVPSILDLGERVVEIEIVRDGGEEFFLKLVGVTQKEAATIAEELRLRIHRHGFQILSGTRIHQTASLGVATVNDGMEIATVEALKQAADCALYFAKTHGRNQVVITNGEIIKQALERFVQS